MAATSRYVSIHSDKKFYDTRPTIHAIALIVKFHVYSALIKCIFEIRQSDFCKAPENIKKISMKRKHIDVWS